MVSGESDPKDVADCYEGGETDKRRLAIFIETNVKHVTHDLDDLVDDVLDDHQDYHRAQFFVLVQVVVDIQWIVFFVKLKSSPPC